MDDNVLLKTIYTFPFRWSQRNSYLKSIPSTQSCTVFCFRHLNEWQVSTPSSFLSLTLLSTSVSVSLEDLTSILLLSSAIPILVVSVTCMSNERERECLSPSKLDFHWNSLVSNRGIGGKRKSCGNNVSKINIYFDFIYNPDNLTRGKREKEERGKLTSQSLSLQEREK